MLANFVISIRHATERRQHITETFGKQNIPFTFFDAVTPQEGLNEGISRHVPALASADNLTAGEKACFMSHVLLWQHCVDANLPYIAIFEDDILLSTDAAAFLNEDGWLKQSLTPQHSFILRLESSPFPSRYQPCPVLLPYRKHHFLTLSEQQICTAGYIISQAAAQWLLKQCAALPANFNLPLDDWLFGPDFLFHETLLLAQITPALCMQESFYHASPTLGSQLEAERRLKRPFLSKRKSWHQKLIHALTKISREHRKYKQRIIENHMSQYSPRHIIPFTPAKP
ncbi:glycosyltransferase family 25 protein [Conchiformibius steedae]|uniref:glycosyltransferase family 25 protein n=1 Tax=Conchiformibius steedae TaxID=153493 RepID=UPI0026EF5122|nr:glycosyltransferase family 25 protein [Conchiformibius steedae]